ncbi:glycoside hydrolase family 101 beta sandwich domain-containing protein [Sphingobacterium detergens]
MGWQKGKDFNQVLRNFFTLQLPYRYMMHSPLKTIDENRAIFDNGLHCFVANGQHTMEKEGKTLKKGNTIFIPWDPIKEDKIYFYSDTNLSSTWQLPASWRGLKTIFLYKLTAKGKYLIEQSPVNTTNNSITLQPSAGQGYVIYKRPATPEPPMKWGEGSGIDNPGFDNDLEGWATTNTSASVKTLSYGQDVLQLSKESEIRQQLPVEKGRYYDISVWVQVNGHGKATLKAGNQEIYINESTVKNFFDNTDRYNSYFQRMKVTLKAESEELPLLLSFKSASDSSSAYFDDVRIVQKQIPFTKEDKTYYREDFEEIDEGWGPFIPSQSSAFKTHLSERHTLYTDDNIAGRYALKTWNERDGEVYRTSPTIIQLKPGKQYKLSFDYNSSTDGVYQVVVQSNKDKKEVLRQKLNGVGHFAQFFNVEQSDDYYITIVKSGNGTFILDNFELIEED